MYKEKHLFRSEFVPIRGLAYHVQIWSGPAGAAKPPLPPLILLHGWMDVAASWQFMVDAFSDAFTARRTIIAPDWRGFGQTGSQEMTDNYWFADYLADLDFLLDHYSPGQPVDLAGHSMGGNMAMLYGGIRPARIRRLVNLEGFGMPASDPSQAAARFAKWMDELKSVHRGELVLKSYDDASGVARRLMKTNPRLTIGKAGWLARHWAHAEKDGTWRVLGNPAHKVTSAQLYRLDEVLEIYKCISAPVLAVEASGDSLEMWWKGSYSLAEHHERLKRVPDARVAVVQDAGHMLHHDQPEQLAALIEAFLA